MLANRFDPVTTGEGWAGFVGNAKARQTIRRICDLSRGDGDSAVFLMHGPTGIGKSCAARLAAQFDLGVAPEDVTTTASGRLTPETIREMESDFAHSTLFGSGWKAWVIEEVDKAAAPQVNALLTILETLPRRRVVVLTTNMDPDTLKWDKASQKWIGGLFASRRKTIPAKTEQALLGRCYPIRFTTEGLATTKGSIGPGPLRVQTVAERFGINGKPADFYVKHFRKAGGSIREAINTLLTC